MRYTLSNIKQPLSGIIDLPTSKSIANRALIIRALSGCDFNIYNVSDSDDTAVLIKALESDSYELNIGHAGTAMRFLTAYLSFVAGECILTGSGRMKNRPIEKLVSALQSLGADIKYVEKHGYPPLKIQGGQLNISNVEIDSNISSQYISALIMVGAFMSNGLTITLKGKVISSSYIKLTLGLLSEFGIEWEWINNKIAVKSGSFKPKDISIEPDWSAASYWYQIAALSSEGEIKLNGLTKNSTQGDAVVAELFDRLGVSSDFMNDGVVLTKNNNITDLFEHNFINCPDIAQTLTVSCCMLNVPFRFTGVESLKIKETDRIAALICELAKLGYKLHEPAEGELAWSGERVEADTNIAIDTYEDHRMAMSFAPVAVTGIDITINDPEVVSKSYAQFWNDLKNCLVVND